MQAEPGLLIELSGKKRRQPFCELGALLAHHRRERAERGAGELIGNDLAHPCVVVARVRYRRACREVQPGDAVRVGNAAAIGALDDEREEPDFQYRRQVPGVQIPDLRAVHSRLLDPRLLPAQETVRWAQADESVSGSVAAGPADAEPAVSAATASSLARHSPP